MPPATPPLVCQSASSLDTPGDGGPRKITTQELFQAGSEVLIQHGAETYRLRITKAGKLILNK